MLIDFKELIDKTKRLTIGRLKGYELKETSYNPVGYILSADKEKEDAKLQLRNNSVTKRTDRFYKDFLNRVTKS